MKIVVMGAGGTGGYFGAKLARGGEDVTFVARGAHLEAIRRAGLRVRSRIEGEFVVRPAAVDDPKGLERADAVLFCVKSFDTEPAAALIRPVIGPDTAVLSVQNGVDNEEKIDGLLGTGHAVGGVAQVFAVIEAPGVIAHTGLGRIIFGELDGRVSPRVRRLGEAFARAGIPAEISADIRAALWQKYLLICAQAGMTCLTRCPRGVLTAIPETWRMYRTILEELAMLASAAGVKLGADVADRILALAASIPPENTSSMYHDLTAGKRLELDALHGYAVRLGERLGIPLPTVFAVYACLKPHAEGRPC